MSDIKRLGSSINLVIVQLPERKDIGVVLQFDSLNNIKNLVEEISIKISEGDIDEAAGISGEVVEILSGYINECNTLRNKF